MIQLLILLIVVGVILWAVETVLPLSPVIKRLIEVVLVVIVCVWLLRYAGLF